MRSITTFVCIIVVLALGYELSNTYAEREIAEQRVDAITANAVRMFNERDRVLADAGWM